LTGCALLYREPALGRGAHAQKASYLDVLTDAQWNPSEYSIGLTRRARGLPLWFSLATHGTHAYTAAIEATLEMTPLRRGRDRSTPLSGGAA